MGKIFKRNRTRGRIMSLFKKKPPLNSEEYMELRRKIDLIEIELTLITDKLTKAISRRVIKKEEPTEPEDSDKYKNPQILPM